MHWKFIAVGKPALAYAAAGVAEYLPRLKRYVKAEVEYLKDGPPPALAARYAKASEGCLRLVLDERGERVSTESLRQRIDRWELKGTKAAALLIGPADGHTPEMRESAEWVISLSPLTLQHELALVVALEQIYRVYTMKNGEPYHR